MANKGFLMAMMEPPPTMEEEFNDWYDMEHTPDRKSIPGFENALRFVCVSGWPKYVSFYDLTSIAVLDSAAYRAVAWDRFSPWSKRILPRVRGQYRGSGDQIYPGNAVTGKMQMLTLIRFRGAPDSERDAIVAGMRANFDHRQETSQVRVFRSDYNNNIDYIGLVESRSPIETLGLDLSKFGAAAQTIDLVNRYVPYWTRGPLAGVTTTS